MSSENFRSFVRTHDSNSGGLAFGGQVEKFVVSHADPGMDPQLFLGVDQSRPAQPTLWLHEAWGVGLAPGRLCRSRNCVDRVTSACSLAVLASLLREERVCSSRQTLIASLSTTPLDIQDNPPQSTHTSTVRDDLSPVNRNLVVPIPGFVIVQRLRLPLIAGKQDWKSRGLTLLLDFYFSIHPARKEVRRRPLKITSARRLPNLDAYASPRSSRCVQLLSTAQPPHGMLGGSVEQQAMERRTICFPHYGTQSVLQHGDPGFKDEIERLYVAEENNALEALIALKDSLRHLSTDDFWAAATEGMSKVLGAEICFIMKRVLVDDQQSAVEMPPIGAPGSCMMAAALHYCSNEGTKETYKSTKFHAYGCPCAYMRHDKVFVIPERLGTFITNNPNKLPTPCEAYIAVPLFEEGKCFGHFGAMWSGEGAAQRKLSWAFIEMIMHSLEDMIAQRFTEGANFIRKPSMVAEGSRVIPHDAVTLAQSLRPWAGSLSHELRTPMQGIVGMLDVMYATVQEAIISQPDARVRQVFETLKENIETVQDSSRRAVEAADNVVHAYDMDMSVPDAPPQLPDEPSESSLPTANSHNDRRPDILVAGSNLPLARPNKRRREEAFARSTSNASSSKAPRLGRAADPSCRCSESTVYSEEERSQVEAIAAITSVPGMAADEPSSPTITTTPSFANRTIAPGLRHTSLRELLQFVINDSLKIGGRPDSAFAQETQLGEIVEVRTRGSDGSSGQKLIEWSIDPSVPTTMFVDEKDLTKLISCVVINALKFTDQAEGKVGVRASMRNRGRYLSVKVSDNGPGIPADFLPKLFKPFSQENASITRSSEGLGLGLMVAKGIARKLGGDLMCTHTATAGNKRGAEFEIKIPMQAGETISRASSPFASPMPRKAQIAKEPAQQQAHLPPAAIGSPGSLSRALHEVVSAPTFFPQLVDVPSTATSPTPTTPPSPRSMTCPSDDSTSPTSAPEPPVSRPRYRKAVSSAPSIDRELATKYPLTFLVAEDNKINRKLLVSMLSKFGYKNIHEAHDGNEAVRQMKVHDGEVDVVLMDLWMPLMDGYEATEKILGAAGKRPTVLAVTADVTDGALGRAAEVGMKGYMTKPYKLADLQRLIEEYCASHEGKKDEPLPEVRAAVVA